MNCSTLKNELQSRGTAWIFPDGWSAAYIDFGMVGAVIYILHPGGLPLAGARTVRHSDLRPAGAAVDLYSSQPSLI